MRINIISLPMFPSHDRAGAVWLLFMCLIYPESKWFIGREELKRIRSSTLITFQKVCKEYSIPQSEWRYNGQDNYIQFKNGSRIDMLDLQFKPSDPFYERFGSLEYTGGWIEEGGEINFGAFDVLNTRIGRHLNKEFGLPPKMFVTCNPKKNWMYSHFYKPFKEGVLKPIQKFLQAFVQENPFIDHLYIEQLQNTKDKEKKERLLHGNWEYDDNYRDWENNILAERSGKVLKICAPAGSAVLQDEVLFEVE